MKPVRIFGPGFQNQTRFLRSRPWGHEKMSPAEIKAEMADLKPRVLAEVLCCYSVAAPCLLFAHHTRRHMHKVAQWTAHLQLSIHAGSGEPTLPPSVVGSRFDSSATLRLLRASVVAFWRFACTRSSARRLPSRNVRFGRVCSVLS